MSFNIILKKSILPTASHDLLPAGDVIIQWTKIHPSLKFADLHVRDEWFIHYLVIAGGVHGDLGGDTSRKCVGNH